MDETIPRYPDAGTWTDQVRQVRVVRYACAAAVVVLVAGLWLKLPYLTEECGRLEPWKIVELWCADILALWWFIRFAVVHAIWGEPLTAVPFENRRHQIRAVAITGVAALLLDLGFTFYLMYDEQARYARGMVTEGQALDVQVHTRELEDWYEVDCRFTNAAGAAYVVHVRVEAKGHNFPTGLPAETSEMLTAKSPQGTPLRVRYDPQFPARAWADGAGWDDGNRIYWFSVLTLMFQAIVTALFLSLLAKFSLGAALPWWWDIYKVLPLCVGAFWLFVMGLIDRAMDSV
jgi:hypothetical protein